MAATTFDINTWYLITPLTQNYSALLSGWGDTDGAAFLSTTNASNEAMQWQLYPLTDPASKYLFRCRTRDYGFLGTQFKNSSDNPSDCAEAGITCSTALYMRTGADESAVWTLTSWGDGSYGSYYLTNQANGTGYHVDEQPNDSWLYMNSNTTAGNEGQQWTFTSVAAIDDSRFSTVANSLLLFQSSTTSATTTSTTPATVAAITPAPTTTTSQKSASPSASSSASTSTSSQSSGLSTGAAAGIGVAVGIVAIVALAFLIWFLLRRRRNRRPRRLPSDGSGQSLSNMDPSTQQMMAHESTAHKVDAPYNDSPLVGRPLAEAPGHAVMRQEMGDDVPRGRGRYELPSVHTDESRWELP